MVMCVTQHKSLDFNLQRSQHPTPTLGHNPQLFVDHNVWLGYNVHLIHKPQLRIWTQRLTWLQSPVRNLVATFNMVNPKRRRDRRPYCSSVTDVKLKSTTWSQVNHNSQVSVWSHRPLWFQRTFLEPNKVFVASLIDHTNAPLRVYLHTHTHRTIPHTKVLAPHTYDHHPPNIQQISLPTTAVLPPPAFIRVQHNNWASVTSPKSPRKY